MPIYNDYLPEELEPGNRELTSLLEYIYQQPAEVERIQNTEQARILARARARLLNTERTPGEAQQDTRPPLVLLNEDTPTNPLAAIPPRSQPLKARRTSRIARAFNAIAAVLVVCGLIAGAVVLFTFTHHPSNVGSPINISSPTSVSSPVNISSPTSVGSPTQSQSSSCFLHLDAGLVYVCQHHLYQSFNNTQDIAGYRVALTRAYADSNRVVVSAEMTPLNSKVALADLMPQNLTTAKGLELTGATGEGAADGPGEEAVNIYTLPSSLANASTLALHLTMQIVPKSSGKGGRIPATDIHNLSFDFSLPVHSELRTIAINQTKTLAKGGTLTIKDLRLSSSEAIFDAVYQPVNNNVIPSGADLTIGTEQYTDDNVQVDFSGISASSPEVQVRFNYALYDAHGAAKLIIAQGKQGSWSYHFTIP